MPLHRQPTIEEVRAALEASYKSMTPKENFERMVRNGLINAEGKLTRLFGGDAEPEPGARPPVSNGAINGNGSANGED